MPRTNTPLAVFLHAGEYDRVHQGLAIAAAGAAAGRPVHVFFFWWALERLAADALDEPDFGPERTHVSERFERRNAPTLRRLLEHLKDSGRCTLYACTGSMAVLGLEPSALEARVDRFAGWSTILQVTADVTDRYYL